MKHFFTLPLLCLTAWLPPLPSLGQTIIRETIEWEEEPETFEIGGRSYERWRFSGAFLSDEHPGLPYLFRRFPVNGPGQLRVEVRRAEYEPVARPAASGESPLAGELSFETQVEREGPAYFGKIAFPTIVLRGGRQERLKEIELVVWHEQSGQVNPRGPNNANNSVLSDGDIYKIAVKESGMHKLSYNFLRNELGVDLDRVDPRRIRLYGNGGGMLPYSVDAPRADDLVENHIHIEGGEDGRFDPNDYLLFYAEGPDRWRHDPSRGGFEFEKNIYATRNYYFLKIGPENGARVAPQASLDGTAYTSESFDDYARFEEDKINLLHEWSPNLAQGSGQRWYGDLFRTARERRYDRLFEFPNLEPQSPARLSAEMALRALERSRFILDINGRSFSSATADRVATLSGPAANEVNYAATARLEASLELDAQRVDAILRYPHPSGPSDGSEGWLDFIQIEARRGLVFTAPQMAFRDTRTLAHPSAEFRLGGAGAGVVVWDITDPLRPRRQETIAAGAELRFGAATTILRNYVAFQPAANLLVPEALGKIPNQNLHSLDNVDMVILHHEDFADEAARLADHRRRHSGLSVAAVRVDQIFNEFSSGKVDPTAIRDFARMLYRRNGNFRYLLLFGDGSFDTRDIYGLGRDFIPTYQTESFNPVFAFPSDDYYGLLENNHPNNALAGTLNIAVGRLPVNTAREARAAVDKIIRYETDPATLREWRNRLAFVADDGDGMQHTTQANQISDTLSRRHGIFNMEKIYLDAYPKQATAGGQFVPGANEAINQAIFRGVLVMTYLGHGGREGWAQERILRITDILNWTNGDRMPLFITATCTFAGYDNPAFTSAGEHTLLNERGGAIALFTTVRAVYSTENRRLTEEALNTLFEQPDGRTPTIGEAMRRAKNNFTGFSIITNARKFALLGDPALKLALPEYQVVSTHIDQSPLGPAPDTLRALQRVTVQGAVLDANGQVFDNFNGILYPTVFDKKVAARTLGQDRGSFPYDYTVQRSIIFRGRASVRQGRFSFTFVVPKDIDFAFGPGKISYYVAEESTRRDGAGYLNNVIIGGINPNVELDREGPEVDVYLNTPDFVFGAITGPNPTLLVHLADESGINVVGNSIGHDLEGVLDDDTQNAILLNDFYEAELDDYRRGTVRYPLSKLDDGLHSIRVKAWDVANNSSEGYTEFIVASSPTVALQRVLNYPNPFTDRTCFQFDHNLANQEIDVLIQIFTISGRLVKTIEHTMFTDGAIRRDDCIPWDGRDDYGDRLARGVYLYQVKVRANAPGSAALSGESKFEKLVLLK